MGIWQPLRKPLSAFRQLSTVTAIVCALAVSAVGPSSAAPASKAAPPPSAPPPNTGEKKSDLVKTATITVEQYQVAFIGSGNLGGGKLDFNGKTYSFTIGGLGIGGFGVSKIKASGIVYNLKNLKDFAGAYVQGRYGFAAADKSAGKLWLQNDKNIVIEIKGDREGLALSLGGDAVYIDFD